MCLLSSKRWGLAQHCFAALVSRLGKAIPFFQEKHRFSAVLPYSWLCVFLACLFIASAKTPFNTVIPEIISDLSLSCLLQLFSCL